MPLFLEQHPRPAPTEVLWSEAPLADHSVQVYSDIGLFLDALEGFVSGGLRSGESVAVIALPKHRRALERRLRVRGFDLDRLRAEDRFMTCDAETALAQFAVDGWPDADRFRSFAAGLLGRGSGRPLRAFGEMVALLWQQGHHAGAVRLEQLWSQLLEEEGFRLFCAYPRSGFTPDAEDKIGQICAHHSRVIPD